MAKHTPMASLAEEQGTKRKRVFRACDSCRAMKSKCDGARPACGRCTGYGYKCVYALSGKRNINHRLTGASPVHDGQGACCQTATALHSAAAEYDTVIRDILPKLNETDRASTEDVLKHLEDRLNQIRIDASACEVKTGQLPLPKPGGSGSPTALHKRPSISTAAPRPVERYLGEVSDVRFFNLVDRALADKNGSASERSSDNDHQKHGTATGDEALESYEQDDPSPEAAAAHQDVEVEFPGTEAAERYFDIYFTTIHIAYPFLPRALFTQSYRTFIASNKQTVPNDTWLATMYIIFAIGAYYNAASGGTATQDTLHEQYYRHALTLSSGSEPLERSLNQVSFLLAQCFYLLAVCRTDTCWTTLGLAVRIAQSIGLHVDADAPRPRARNQQQNTETIAFRNAELRRRVFYSVYVLDRLLALQLGRPPAIHDEDCYLRLPSRLGDGDINWLGSDDHSTPPQPILDPNTPTCGDYFINMISLSRIIGHVLRDLYSPRSRRRSGTNGVEHVSEGESTTAGTDDDVGIVTDWLLPSTKRLDRQLLEWRRALPRKLRFDFGHAFDNTSASATSAVFKRQRNMLAIKFHHLRAVIHRPYLCLPLLRRLDEDSAGSGDETTAHRVALPNHRNNMVGRYEKVCIMEAQATAHLLHNVVDKQNLVHDFPWWQMISCLVYASSILVVASAFARRRLGETGTYEGYGPLVVEDGAAVHDDSDAVDAAALEDDAETCLTVFEALSPNSESARLARDMMRRLKARGAAWRDSHVVHEAAPPVTATPDVNMATIPSLEAGTQAPPPIHPPAPFADHPMSHAGGDVIQPGHSGHPGEFVPVPMQTDTMVGWPMLQEWPLEILDSMEWSTQFFNTVDGNL
ncbi:hypothetical protein SEUCBS139899_002194 [Sporothrix eucalyptigena]|uniref:Zn(2)-C6 fungal-type domain-containing protein n=1 Tax=Sporothrix eucalyptigena TaxID=1812306 RepID=A0ABP0B4V5_9PEZI